MQEDYQNLENDKSPRPPFIKEGNNNHPAPLGRGQKIAAAVLMVFAVAVVGMWMAQFKKSITGPFDYKKAETRRGASLQIQQQEEDSEEALRAKDTDGDGLSDWDELYFYKTSPYLEDSDSDGFTDKQEVDSENDPNCPTGRDCYGPSALEAGGSNLPDTNPLSGLLNQLGTGNEGGRTGGNADLEAIVGGRLDAATLRQMLLASGSIDKNMLDKISDEDLVRSYQAALNQ